MTNPLDSFERTTASAATTTTVMYTSTYTHTNTDRCVHSNRRTKAKVKYADKKGDFRERIRSERWKKLETINAVKEAESEGKTIYMKYIYIL